MGKEKETEDKEVNNARQRKVEATKNDNTMATPKKVQFKRLNTSKSYKASIKDLKKIDHNAERTPEKSILLKRKDDESYLADKQQSSSKKSRKKRRKSKT